MRTSRRSLLKNSALTLGALSLGGRIARAQEQPIRIGVIYDLSGPFAAAGSVACSIGAQIAIDLVNERGGVAGKYKIEPINADSQSKADAAINEVERLISQEKVEVVLGVYSSAHAVPLAAKVEEHKKILWITTAVATAVVKDRKLTHVFRGQIHSDQYGEAAAGFLADNAKAKLGVEPSTLKVAIIHEDGPYGVGVGEAGEQFSKQRGLQVLMREGYSAGAPDLSSLVTKLKRARADVILHTGYNPDITLFLRQARESGLRFKMLIGNGAGYSQLDKLRATFGNDIDNFCNIDPVAAQLLDPWSSVTSQRPRPPTCRRMCRWGSTRPGCCSTTCCPSPKKNMAVSMPRRSARQLSMWTSRRVARFRVMASSSIRPEHRLPDKTSARLLP